MTRQQYIELAQARLKRIDSTGQFRFQYVEGAFDFVWQNSAFKHMGMASTDTNFYTKLYEAEPVLQDAGGRYYSDLPEAIINLPRVSSGVVRIVQLNARDFDFAPISERDFTMMASQEVYQVGTTIYFYVNKDRIVYGDSMSSSIASAGVDMKLCIPFSKYDLDEELPMPAGQSEEFFASVINYLAGTQPVDLSNINTEKGSQ